MGGEERNEERKGRKRSRKVREEMRLTNLISGLLVIAAAIKH